MKKIIYGGLAGIYCIDGKRKMYIDSEALESNDKQICIWEKTIKYWETNDGKLLATQGEIIEIKRELENKIGKDKILWDNSSRDDWI